MQRKPSTDNQGQLSSLLRQLAVRSIDPIIEVRIIGLFVDSLSVKEYVFRADYVENDRPADLLKLFIYGYMNKVRSTRDLEKECQRNI